jgi:N-glycosylase/DNA lyase
MILRVTDFSLDKTLNAGQTFAWEKKDGVWLSATSNPIIVRQTNPEELEYYGVTENVIKEKLGMNDDIDSINAEIDKDDFIDKAIEYSKGLRVVQDGIWPATLGFLLSIQSNIPLILKRIRVLSGKYGEHKELESIKFNGFPDYTKIFDGGIEALKELKLGFRYKFVFSAAKFFAETEISNDIEEIKVQLLSITGVGEKVLDCILLYGLHDLSAFPMDVWISRIIYKHYSHILKDAKKYADARELMAGYFGRYAGYAQLFLYNYSRLNKLK